jgi:hypothetical protein
VTRSAADRVADVRRLLSAADDVYRERRRLAPAIAEATGLSPEGVELGFESLEREASDEELRSLVASAGDAPQVHVVLSANVFVAPLRALALARAASSRVTIRPSPRDPVLTRALVEAASDPAIQVVEERDVASVLGAGEVHVYGRDETIAEVRRGLRARARENVRVRGYGAGMGAAVVSEGASIERAAEDLARDVVAFDQRGCLSPSVVAVLGDDARAASFGEALHERLDGWAVRVPRGDLGPEEQAEASRWRDAMAFAGSLHGELRGGGARTRARSHMVAVTPEGSPWWPPPPGRHVQVIAVSTSALGERLAPLAPVLVALGTDDPARLAALVALDAPAPSSFSPRVSALGRMQRPALDGPVDRRRSVSEAV